MKNIFFLFKKTLNFIHKQIKEFFFMKTKQKERMDYFPFKPNQVCGIGYIRLISNILCPEAHVLIFNNEEGNKTAYCLDFGLFVDGNDLENAFKNMKDELLIYFSKSFNSKNKNLDLYAFSASDILWFFYRKLAEKSKNKSFFMQNINNTRVSIDDLIKEKENKIIELEKDLEKSNETITNLKEIIDFLKDQYQSLCQSKFEPANQNQKEWKLLA